jgi:hypothetical protein
MSALPKPQHLTPPIPAASLSPSLSRTPYGASAAYELKFLLSEEVAQEVERVLAARMQVDPYAAQSDEGAYAITSTYLDTPRFDVFHRVGRHRFRKLRIRRYGDATWRFLEQKTKRKQRVRKQRSRADEGQLAFLGAPLLLESWDGAWFHRKAMRWELAPVCEAAYLRRAYFAEEAGSPYRLTFDRKLRARAAAGWGASVSGEAIAIGEGEVICEFKFRGAMPSHFREAVERFGLVACGASKYRRSAAALGLVSFDASRSDEDA